MRIGGERQQNAPPLLCLDPKRHICCRAAAASVEEDEDTIVVRRIHEQHESTPSRSWRTLEQQPGLVSEFWAFMSRPGPGSSPSSFHCLLSEQAPVWWLPRRYEPRQGGPLRVVFDSPGSAGMCVCFFSGVLLGSSRVVEPLHNDMCSELERCVSLSAAAPAFVL